MTDPTLLSESWHVFNKPLAGAKSYTTNWTQDGDLFTVLSRTEYSLLSRNMPTSKETTCVYRHSPDGSINTSLPITKINCFVTSVPHHKHLLQEALRNLTPTH